MLEGTRLDHPFCWYQKPGPWKLKCQHPSLLCSSSHCSEHSEVKKINNHRWRLGPGIIDQQPELLFPSVAHLEDSKVEKLLFDKVSRCHENFTFFFSLEGQMLEPLSCTELTLACFGLCLYVGRPGRAVARGWSSEGQNPAEGFCPSSPTSHHTPSGTSLGRDCQAEWAQRVLPSFLVSSLVVLLISPSLIRRRCQHANKISSFNISLKRERFKENEGLVTPWLFLHSATHLPFGQSVPIRERPSSSSTYSFLPVFLAL